MILLVQLFPLFQTEPGDNGNFGDVSGTTVGHPEYCTRDCFVLKGRKYPNEANQIGFS